MATIDDFGGASDSLATPALGGPTGWAAAVRDYIKGLSTQVAGKVSKSGDTMTGTLQLTGGSRLEMDDGRWRYDAAAGSFVADDINGQTASRKNIIINTVPTRADHATSKQYVDAVVAELRAELAALKPEEN